jgi:hypothetical protein
MWRTLKNEVRGEPGGVSLDLLVQSAGAYAVEFCQVAVQHHALATHQANLAAAGGRARIL